MSPIIRTNILLLLVAMALAWSIYIRQAESTADYAPITSLASDQIKKITIQKEGNTLLILKKHGQQWLNALGDETAMETAWVNKLLHISQLPSLHHFPLANKDPQRFGLHPPRYQLQLNDTVLDFGKIDPATGLRYIQIGSQIHLISDSYTHYLVSVPYQQPAKSE